MNRQFTNILLGGCVAGGALLLGACGDDDGAAGPPCEPASGQICTIAGTGISGFGGDDGPAYLADLSAPVDVTFGPDDRMYVVDWNNHRLRVVDDEGVITTLAGTGNLGDGPPGPALQSDFNHPTNIIFDSQGRLLISAWHNSRIKRFDPATGNIEDVCGTGRRAYNGDEGPAAMADLDLPASLAFSPDGNLFVLDQANQMIRYIDSSDVIHRFAGQCIIGMPSMEGEEPTQCPMSNKLAFGIEANPMVCAMPCPGGFAGDGGPALEARLSQPFGQSADPAGHLLFDGDGNLYFADTKNHRIRRIDTDGIISTIAGTGTAGADGDGGPATEAQLNNPVDIELGADGTLYIADTYNSCVRAIDPEGTITTVAGVCGTRGSTGDGGSPTEALLDRPYGIALDRAGNLYVVDTRNNRIRVVLR